MVRERVCDGGSAGGPGCCGIDQQLEDCNNQVSFFLI